MPCSQISEQCRGGNCVELWAIHVVVGDEKLAKFCIVGCEHSWPSAHGTRPPGVKKKGGVYIDANIFQRQKHSAGGLAGAFIRDNLPDRLIWLASSPKDCEKPPFEYGTEDSCATTDEQLSTTTVKVTRGINLRARCAKVWATSTCI